MANVTCVSFKLRPLSADFEWHGLDHMPGKRFLIATNGDKTTSDDLSYLTVIPSNFPLAGSTYKFDTVNSSEYNEIVNINVAEILSVNDFQYDCHGYNHSGLER